jgi:uncharacterized membrane protein
MKLFLWYLCAAVCVIISALMDIWFGWFIWVIPLLIFSFLIAFGVLVHPVPKAGNNIDKYPLIRIIEVLVIIVPVIGIIVNFLFHEDNTTGTFFGIINLWAFRLVIVCLVVIVLMYLREEIRTAAKVDKELQSKADRN